MGDGRTVHIHDARLRLHANAFRPVKRPYDEEWNSYNERVNAYNGKMNLLFQESERLDQDADLTDDAVDKWQREVRALQEEWKEEEDLVKEGPTPKKFVLSWTQTRTDVYDFRRTVEAESEEELQVWLRDNAEDLEAELEDGATFDADGDSEFSKWQILPSDGKLLPGEDAPPFKIREWD